MFNRWIYLGVAAVFVAVAAFLVSFLFGFAGFLVDLNFGLGTALASSGTERLWTLMMAFGAIVGALCCGWAARRAVHRAVRRQKFFLLADWMTAAVVLAAAVALFVFGRA